MSSQIILAATATVVERGEDEGDVLARQLGQCLTRQHQARMPSSKLHRSFFLLRTPNWGGASMNMSWQQWNLVKVSTGFLPSGGPGKPTLLPAIYAKHPSGFSMTTSIPAMDIPLEHDSDSPIQSLVGI
ncbi:hypothetical protein JB92DRAFT_2838242 [Gautieria morchelliformis]|nr:hypothetical protein JB92DRAFT_2838242 [Gautieria morchelliformis]